MSETAITTAEKTDFSKLDEVVRTGMSAFLDVGRALMEIRDRRLYRDTFGTFEEYCRERHEMTRRYANYLIDCNVIADDLGTIVPILPATESQYRELAPLADTDRQECWQNVVAHAEETGEAITAKVVKEFAEPYRRPQTEDQAADDFEPCSTDDLHELVIRGDQFDTIYADPAWDYGNKATRAAAEDHYGTMSLDDIKDLPVAELAAEQSLLYLWTTTSFLFDAFFVMREWGFEYKTNIVWDKQTMGLGNYYRISHEHLLVGTRGGLRSNGANQLTVVPAPREKHSAKPHVFRDIIENTAPGNRRLELFAREQRPGWSVWGNQVSRQKFMEAK
jgi:N6-adenosine-specific RNA methylase IME4